MPSDDVQHTDGQRAGLYLSRDRGTFTHAWNGWPCDEVHKTVGSP